MAGHSDDLLNQLLQKMLSNLDSKEINGSDDDGETGLPDIDDEYDERMLVFRDLKGQVWQISRVSDDRTLDFSQLTDDQAEDMALFKP